jgi:hypothetical protein
MILADDEIQFDMAASPDWKIDGSGLTIKLERLVLCFHHRALHIRDSARTPFANAPAMVLKDATSHSER